jgi:hypothetical protein
MFGVIKKVGMDLIFINKKTFLNGIGALTKSFSILWGCDKAIPWCYTYSFLWERLLTTTSKKLWEEEK